MSELVELVSEKAGLPADQAKVAVDTVIGYLKDKLPAPAAGQIDAVLSGGAGASSTVESVTKSLGGLFGKQ